MPPDGGRWVSGARGQELARPMSLAARVVAMVVAPRATLAAVAERPAWAGILFLTAGVVVVSLGVFLSTAIGQQALVDQQVMTRENLGQRVTDAQYEALLAGAPSAAALRVAGAAAGVPAAAFALAALCQLWLGRSHDAARFRRVLAVVAHTGAIVIVRQLVIVPWNFQRESSGSAANLSALFPMLDEGGLLATFLGVFDLFALWWMLVLAMGLSVLSGKRTGSIAAGLLGVYTLVAAGIAVVVTALGAE